ncbi:MAG: hypothetical protein ABIP48_11100 [Planctomycetota bacterium]
MSEPTPADPQGPRRRRRFQFGLGAMLLAAVPVSILSAAWAGMMGLGADNAFLPQGFFVLMAAAAPVAVMILFSVCRTLVRLLGGDSRRR